MTMDKDIDISIDVDIAVPLTHCTNRRYSYLVTVM